MYDMADASKPVEPVIIRPTVQPYYPTLAADVWDSIDTSKYDAWGQPR